MRAGVSVALIVAFAALLRPASAQSGEDGTVATSVPTPAREPPASPHRGYTLGECLAFAERNYPKVHEAAAQLERMRAQLWEVKTAPFSNFSAFAGVGLAPTLGGTAIYSPNTDAAITSSMALAWRAGIEGAVPLWTFGKITAARDAAKAQVKVGEHQQKKAKNEVRLTVRQAYYGVLLSRDAQALLREALDRIDKYVPSLEAKVAAGDADDIPLLKLRIFRTDLISRRSEAEKQERIALAGLRFLTGVGPTLDVPDEPLRRVTRPLGPLTQYLTAARLFRPEINMAHAGVLARRALLELERSRFFPDMGLAMTASRSYAPEVADQLNPFVRDEANYLRYGFGLVMSWSLDFLPKAARVAQARAQLDEIRATERFALGGIGVEVETAFADATDANTRLQAFTDATKYAKQWLVKVQQGIDVGTFSDEDIVDPSKEYALKRFAQMSATMDYNVAMAKLALATGWDAVLPGE